MIQGAGDLGVPQIVDRGLGNAACFAKELEQPSPIRDLRPKDLSRVLEPRPFFRSAFSQPRRGWTV